MVEKQEKVIKDFDWDILIILDACRYDYFEKVYGDYLGGDLKKALSPATSTSEWCKKVLETGDFNDVVYVSANAHINSKVKVKGFYGRKHFYKVIDVWDWGWDYSIGTTSPWKVNQGARKARDMYPNKKLIIHYMQPHFPYIHEISGSQQNIPFGIDQLMESPIYRWVRFFLATKLGRIWERTSRYARIIMGLEWHSPKDPAEVAEREGVSVLRRKYESSLRSVLESVAALVENLSGKIVITADNGELLGESGQYGHGFGCRHPLLVEVPWLEIERGKKGLEKSRVKRIIQKMKHEGRL